MMLSKHPFHTSMRRPYGEVSMPAKLWLTTGLYTTFRELALTLHRHRQVSPLYPPRRPLTADQRHSYLRPHTKSIHTHALLVEAIELQSCRSWWLLSTCADLVDRIECMAEDSVCNGTCSSAVPSLMERSPTKTWKCNKSSVRTDRVGHPK